MVSLHQIFGSGKAASLIIGVALCAALLAHGVTQEVPLGSAKGTLTMTESGKRLHEGMVTFIPRFGASDRDIRPRIVEANKDGEFSVRNLPAGNYVVEVSTEAHDAPDKLYTIQEGKTLNLDIELKPRDPYMELYADQHVFTPTEPVEFKLHGFNTGEESVQVDVYKLDFDKVLKEGSLYSALAPIARGNPTAKDPTTMGTKVRSDRIQVRNRDAEGIFIEYVKGGTFSPGIYWVNCVSGKLARGTWLNVTNLALVTKTSGTHVANFVTDITTGKPIAGARVGLSEAGVFKEMAQTDSSGRANFELSDAKKGVQVVLATNGDSKALLDFQKYAPQSEAMKIAMYTERPIYRPGDTVQYKGFARKLSGTEYVLPSPGNATVEFFDESDSLLDTQTVAVGAHGSFSGNFKLNPELGPGNYRMACKFEGQTADQYVTVAAYRKPQYSIKVVPEKSLYVRGDKIRVAVEVEYFFGGPVIGADVTGYVYRNPYWNASLYGDDFDEEDIRDSEGYRGGGEVSSDIKTKTDSQGKAYIEFDSSADPEWADQDWTYDINVSVVDQGGQYFDGHGSVNVMRGEIGMAVDSDKYIAEKDAPVAVTVKLQSNSPGSQPIQNHQVQVVTEYEQWSSGKSATLAQTEQTVTTDAVGEAHFSVSGKHSGDLVVRATTQDSRGNNIVARTSVWISGSDPGYADYRNDLTVKLDKKSYKAGDRVTALVSTNKPGGSVWITLEGANLHESRIVEMTSNLATASFEIKDEYAPNVYVCAAYVREKRFSETSKRLKVELGHRNLNISLTSDRDHVKPGEALTYTIKTTTTDGKPTSADVSLAVVDEAIYAIAEDRTNLIQDFYPNRNNSVQTVYSFPDIYLDGGDKAPSQVQVRRKFRDLASWTASVITDSSGTGTVHVELPENLTSWRATAIGMSDRTEIGKTKMNVVASKDLMIRLEGPSFVTGTDRQLINALVTNSTNTAQEVTVSLEAQNATVEGKIQQQIHVGAGETQAIAWRFTGQRTGTATFVAKAVSSSTNDGVEHKIEVLPHGREFVDRWDGLVNGSATVNAQIRDNADPETGRLLLTIQPSLASSLVQSLDDLIDFPYGCVEQTMSRFMPTVVVSQACRAGGLPPLKRASEIPAMVVDGMTRLKRMQHSDGGWGWWDYDESDSGMTAYVLEGLYRAKQAGFNVNPAMLDRGLAYVRKKILEPMPTHDEIKDDWPGAKEYRLQRHREDLEDGCGLGLVLALWADKENALTAFAKYAGSDTPAGGLAAASVGYGAAGDKDRQRELLTKLYSLAKRDGELIHWEGRYDYTSTESTARALQAVAAAEPQSPDLDRILRYLIAAKRGGMWVSTKDTAVIVSILASRLAETKELQPDGEVQIVLNGETINRITIDKSALTSPDLKVSIPLSKLKSGSNDVRIVKSGQSRCYYSAELRQVQVQQDIGTLSNSEGLTVERTYHRLEPQKLEDGTTRLLPSEASISSIAKGGLVRVKLVIHSDKPREFVIVEDPIPSGCRIAEREDLGEGETWSWWYSKMQIFDDHLAVFARDLPRGDSVLEYTMRAEGMGQCSALPTTIYNMYDPDKRASCAESRLDIR